VFNVEQIDGLPERFHALPEVGLSEDLRVARAEAFFRATGVKVRHFGDMAFYAPTSDLVQLPRFASFRDPEAYYTTLAHECVHWTGHASRLDRRFGKVLGDEAYAREEFVAELGAAFLCADLGLALEPRNDHAAYVGAWLAALRGDKRFVFAAAAMAQRACDFLHGLQVGEGP
jgi:antirestriction protein ArdC